MTRRVQRLRSGRTSEQAVQEIGLHTHHTCHLKASKRYNLSTVHMVEAVMWKPCLGWVSPSRDQHIPETALATLGHFVQFWKRAGDALVGGGRPRLGRHKRGEERSGRRAPENVQLP